MKRTAQNFNTLIQIERTKWREEIVLWIRSIAKKIWWKMVFLWIWSWLDRYHDSILINVLRKYVIWTENLLFSYIFLINWWQRILNYSSHDLNTKNFNWFGIVFTKKSLIFLLRRLLFLLLLLLLTKKTPNLEDRQIVLELTFSLKKGNFVLKQVYKYTKKCLIWGKENCAAQVELSSNLMALSERNLDWILLQLMWIISITAK